MSTQLSHNHKKQRHYKCNNYQRPVRMNELLLQYGTFLTLQFTITILVSSYSITIYNRIKNIIFKRSVIWVKNITSLIALSY